MGKICIENVQIVDPFYSSVKKQDIEIDTETPGTVEIDGTGKYVFPAFVDVHIHLRHPGYPEKETLESGAQAALHGGFAHVIAMANTKPVMAGEEISAFYEAANSLPIHAYTVSALTEGLRGKRLVDMADAARRGAVGFSDDGFPVADAALLEAAMEKAAALDLPISLHEEHPDFVHQAGIDSRYADLYALEGAEVYGEYALAARDLALAKKTGAKLDIQHISAEITARLVAAFGASGARVLGELTPHHMTMTAADVRAHGPMAKMNPPLRTAFDRDELAKLLKDPHLCVATDHAPHTKEKKARPFPKAPSGIVGLETAFCLLYTELVQKDVLSLYDFVDAMTRIPARFYRLPHKGILGGEFVLFDPAGTTEVTEDFFWGKGSNSPLLGQTLNGRIEGVMAKGVYHAF